MGWRGKIAGGALRNIDVRQLTRGRTLASFRQNFPSPERKYPMLDRQVLVLNRLWQAINVCTVRRAFTLVCQGHAQIVFADGGNNFRTHDFDSWRDFSHREPEEEMVHTIQFKIRIPRIIVLMFFDRL